MQEETPEPVPGWSVVCATVEEWQELIESLKEYKTGPEKHLCRILEQDYLPEIVDIVAQRVCFCVCMCVCVRLGDCEYSRCNANAITCQFLHPLS